ncbi:alpha/beta hydrolase fold [Chitinophaga sp. YR573]|uniref:alpha/beta fold hydrolase n=1 Tax=Chitinophaga sp. YR573 TaxID=1881040 RepID=UPI0008CDCE1B|nr:alpha/beta hydrolase [Chitinophaga sp. YR573]SEW42754.1 alpha/beta hydrolase fold [Chitinophaga sp. YR573]
MKNNCSKIFAILFACTLLVLETSAQQRQPVYKKTDGFPGLNITDPDVQWGYFTVPENWDIDNGNSVQLAVAVIKSHNKQSHEGVVFLAGGPGGNAVRGIRKWLNNPILNDHDIILVDVRGAGLSTPQLCPELGKEFMGVMAENDDDDKEIADRVKAAVACRDELLKRKIDISMYNSHSVASDLHALKQALGYDKWMVYSVSYGTRMALEYVRDFPQEVTKVVFDSPVLPVAGLYDNNTSNYVRSLEVLFEKCRQDKSCSSEYGDLKELYQKTVSDLEKNPITIKVPQSLVSTGKFTLNAQDFMIAVQQGLYDPRFFEVLPLIIKEFNHRNEEMITSLFFALRNRLSLDYGTYYCVLCKETLPLNSIDTFIGDAAKNQQLTSGGLPFYKGDYSICEKWFGGIGKDTVAGGPQLITNIPALIVSGEFDPVTPPAVGKKLQALIPGSVAVVFPGQGHVPGYSSKGTEVIHAFFNGTLKTTDISNLQSDNMRFITHVRINGGLSRVAGILNNPKLSLIWPLTLSLLVLVLYLFIQLIRKKKLIIHWVIILAILVTILAEIGFIYAINATAAINPYVLSVGLPVKFSYLFVVLYLLLVIVLLAFALLVRFTGRLGFKNTAFSWTALTALLVINAYFFYWGLLF